MGDVCSDGPGAPWSWQRVQYTLGMCNSTLNNNPLPLPPAPAVTLTTLPTPDQAASGAVYAGADSSGAAVFAVPETASQSQATITQNLQNYFTGLDAQVNTAPGAGGFQWGTLLAIGGAVLGTVLLFNIAGGRR